MSARRVRIAGVTLLAALASACNPYERYAESYEERAWRERSEKPWPELDMRAARIAEELKHGSLPAWAGAFHGSDHGRCSSDHVDAALAPASGIVWERGWGWGPRKNCGSVLGVDGSWIRVAWEFPTENTATSWYGGREPMLSDRLWLSTWGDREFLVPECELARFVNLVNGTPEGARFFDAVAFRWRSGAEPDAALSYDERAEREEQRPRGSPTLPEPWASRVRSTPLVASVVEVERPVVEREYAKDDADELSQTLRIDAGTAEGVFVGMELLADGRPCEVVACDEHASTCVVRWVRIEERSSARVLPLAPGKKLRSDRDP